VCCVFALLIAATKFRKRDPAASLSGEVDSQIILELSIYAVVTLVLAVVIWRSRPRLVPLRGAESLLLGYVIFAALSSAWSAAPLLSLCRSGQLAVLYVLALVFVRSWDPGRALRMLSIPLAWYVIICAALAAVFPWAAGGKVDAGFGRFSWFSVHPISAATFAGLAALMLGLRLIDGQSERERRRLWIFLLTAILLGIALLTRSRGPLLAWIAAFGVAALLPRLRGGLIPLATAVLLVAVLLFENSGLTVRELLTTWSTNKGALTALIFRGESADAVTELHGRATLWAGAVPLFLQRPWIGRGYLASRDDLLRLFPWAGHAHNAVLESLLDLGLVGSGLLFLAFGTVLLVRSRGVRGLDARLRHASATVLGIGVFELLNGVSSPSFAGAPGYETLLAFTCVSLAAGIRRQAAEIGVARQPVLGLPVDSPVSIRTGARARHATRGGLPIPAVRSRRTGSGASE
jgi:O-antigen ligase